jgi:hypothetical protein
MSVDDQRNSEWERRIVLEAESELGRKKSLFETSQKIVPMWN